MLIGSGTMDVGELLSYQVGEVGRLRPAGVAGPECRHLSSSGSLARTSCYPGVLACHCTHSPKPSWTLSIPSLSRPEPFDLSFPPDSLAPFCSSLVSFLSIHRA